MEGKEIKPTEPIGNDPETGLPIFVMIGRYGPYVQLGPSSAKATQGKEMSKEKAKKGEKKKKPKMASIPKGKDPETVTLEDALTYLTLPRLLGNHPDTNEPITANVGMFGPYVVHQKDFRSLKAPDDVYTIELPRSLEIFAQEKKKRGFAKKKKSE